MESLERQSAVTNCPAREWIGGSRRLRTVQREALLRGVLSHGLAIVRF